MTPEEFGRMEREEQMSVIAFEMVEADERRKAAERARKVR